MFEKKKLWMVMATAALVTACGGGSDPAPVTGGDGDPPPPISSTDTKLQNHLVMHPDQIIVNALLPLSAYTDTTAAGGGLYGQATGTDNNGAPFQTFGFRIDDAVAAAEGGALVEESATGRLAITLNEMAETVGTGETAESVSIVLTGVTFTTAADGTLSVSQADDAAMYVSGTNSDGVSFENVAVSLPADAISIVPISTVPNGDASTDVGLIFNLDEAFAAADTEAAAELTQLAGLSGRFDMNFALSTADIHRSGAALDTQTISAPGQADVEGSGIAGNIWITVTPPTP